MKQGPTFSQTFKIVFFVVLSLFLIGVGTCVGLYFLVVLPRQAQEALAAERKSCESNLSAISLAFRTWATDYDGKFPFNVPRGQGGTLELCGRDANGVDTNPVPHFLAISNELGGPYCLSCPSVIHYTGWTNLCASNLYHLHTARVGEANQYFGGILAYCPKHHLALFSDGEIRYEFDEARAEAEAVKQQSQAAQEERKKEQGRAKEAAEQAKKSAQDEAALNARMEEIDLDSEVQTAKLKLPRDWTFKAGNKRKAKFCGMRDANTALLDFSSGYEADPSQAYAVPLQNLSAFDQKVVRKTAAAMQD